MNVKIRTATPKDLDAIESLCKQLGFPASLDSLRERMELINSHKTHALLVAEGDANIVLGWVHVYEAPSLLSDATVEGGGIVVDKNVRGQGVGRALVKAAEKWAQQRGIKEGLLASRIDRTEAHAFFKSQGFEFVHTTHFFRKEASSK